jgi:4-amino-4-deoxy-L-arabinose transferase-like glycosyltransferase
MISTNNRRRFLVWGALAIILILATALRLANLSELGLANHYYAAAVKSMLQSWHNFFYAAAEPGGSVSVDKPPLGLWIQVLSAGIFGVNSFGLLFPQILAGLLSVAVLYHLVQRWFGDIAGLLAALALVITPVVVATDRNNTMDSTLILVILLATWAFIRATETTRLWYLLLGGMLVGLGFNIKMLQAFLPLPALLALYFLGAKEKFWTKLGKLALASSVLLVISLSWVLAVELTPTYRRPYVGSSGDNSEISLLTGYNGMSRLLGMNRGGGFQPGGIPAGLPNPGNGNRGGLNLNGSNVDGANRGGFPGGGGGIGNVGQVGALRLIIPPLSKEASWLMPFGLLSLGLLIFSKRPILPFVKEHQAVVLWGGWLVTAATFFSIAGFFHEYYLSMLAPPLAALVGIGVVQAWRLAKPHPWLASLLVIATTLVALLLQNRTALAFVSGSGWLSSVTLGLVVLFVIGAVLAIMANIFEPSYGRWLRAAGYASLVSSLLVLPFCWSVLTNQHASDNQSLPAAYDGRSDGPLNFGRTQVNAELLDFLQANAQDTYYLMAVPSAMQGADFVLATGRPVLYMGGFMGQDQVLTPESLADLVDNRKLRFIYSGSGGGGIGGQGRNFGPGAFGGNSAVNNWITSHCHAVQGYDTTTRNAGAPDGTQGGTGTAMLRGELFMSLYDCGK